MSNDRLQRMVEMEALATNKSEVYAVADMLADPRTPAEAKRHWMIDRLWTMALISFVLVLSIAGIVWLGQWPATLGGRRS